MSLRRDKTHRVCPRACWLWPGSLELRVKDIGSKDHGLIIRLPTRRAQFQQWAGPCFRRPAVGLARVPPLAGLGCGRLEG